MSGFEIVGVVLGSIPLIISGLEHYAEGIKTIQRWRQYVREIQSLRRILGNEKAIFQNTLEELLDGIAEPTKIGLLLEDPTAVEWSESALDRKLRKRLHRSYESYMLTARSMAQALDQIRERLGMDLDGKISWIEDGSFTREIKRVKFSFNRSTYQDLLKQLRDDNKSLISLTGSNLRLEATPGRQRPTPRHQGAKFRIIRDSANHAYGALRCGMPCHGRCPSRHTVNLRLETRFTDDGTISDDEEGGLKARLRFHVVLAYGGIASHDTVPLPWDYEEALIRILHRNKAVISSVVHEEPYSVPLSGTSTLVNVTQAVENLSLESAMTQSKRSGRARAARSVRFADPGGVSAETAQTGAASTAPTVGFVPPMTSIERASSYDEITTSDLCEALKGLRRPYLKKQCFVLPDEVQYRYGIFPVPQRTIIRHESFTMIDLADLLSPSNTNKAMRIYRITRLKLAVTMASSVLQLYHTPWLQDRWSTKSIKFMNNDQLALDYPVVSTEVAHDTAPGSPNSNDNFALMRNLSIFALGIALIELCLETSLAERRLPSEINADGRTDRFTDYRTATRLLDEVYSEGGGRYGDAVRRCINGDFDCRTHSLDDESFRQAVYEKVVALLEQDLEDFRGLG